MNLKHLNDQTLLHDTETAAHQERQALSVVLHHIREVDRRRLYSTLKCQSLAEYMVKHLKYTENEAWPRIGAMNLLKEIPEIESKINDGTLSLTNLNMANRALKQQAKNTVERKTLAEKRELLSKIENTSKREAQAILQRETGIALRMTEFMRELSDGTFEVRANVSKDSVATIDKLKGRFAHSHPGLTTGQLLELALRALDKATDPAVKAKRVLARNAAAKAEEITTARPVPEKEISVKPYSHFIPSAVRHAVWMRDGGHCTNCESTRAVQSEHIIPVAHGGPSTVENVKLLCRPCNQRRAIEVYGVEKMARYLREPRREYRAS